MSDSIFGISRIVMGAAAARLLGRPFLIADTDSDESLAGLVRSDGIHRAFEILVARYRPRLCALVRAMSEGAGAAGDVDDIVQDVFVRAYGAIRTYNPGKPFRPWLYRIAVNQVLDRRRAGARRPEVAIPSDDILSESHAPVGDPAVSQERVALMARCVGELPIAMRVVFLLRTIDDLSYEEIATAVGTPVGTVKTNLFRARARLREALRDYFEL